MKRKLKKAALPLIRTTEEYASRSSIHGISYAFDKELNTLDRILWLLLVIAFLGVAAVLSGDLWLEWGNEQVNLQSLFLFIFITIFSGCDGPQEHCQAGDGAPLPCSHLLQLWTPRQQYGAEADTGLCQLAETGEKE